MIATKTVTVTAKAPNSVGTFTGTIDANPPQGDFDNERIADFTNLPGIFPLRYSHLEGDPGAEIGEAYVSVQEDNRHLTVEGKLDLSLPLARAVHERMLLPSGNKMALKELSVGFGVDRSRTTTDPNGVSVLHGVELLEVSVVYAGAQRTTITNVKEGSSDVNILRRLDAIEREALAAKLDEMAKRPRTDAELVRELDRLSGKAAAPRGANPGFVVTTAAARLQQTAVR